MGFSTVAGGYVGDGGPATLASLALLNRSFGVMAGTVSIDHRVRAELGNA